MGEEEGVAGAGRAGVNSDLGRRRVTTAGSAVAAAWGPPGCPAGEDCGVGLGNGTWWQSGRHPQKPCFPNRPRLRKSNTRA